MLWAWNALMAVAPYFKRRFASSKPILDNFQAAELSVSTVANLASMIVLTKLQANASYARRIVISLLGNSVMFLLLAISTRAFLGVSPGTYLGFLMTMVLVTSVGTGFMQNGSFAYVSRFQRPEYMQAIMLGQAVAGVLPPIVQIVSVLSAGETETVPGQDSSTSAFSYFLAATGVAAVTLLAFCYLHISYRPGNNGKPVQTASTAGDEDSTTDHSIERDDNTEIDAQDSEVDGSKSVPLTYLARRLFYAAIAVFLNFAVTMVFPVFTQEILSTNPNPPPLLQEAAFIPLGYLLWNIGDLAGRVIPLVPRLSLATRPKVLLILSIVRIVFIPLYLMCNIQQTEEQAAAGSKVVLPDVIYLLLVQLPFGVSNGYIGSCCMMGAGGLVEEDEGEAAGAFMGLMLVSGLAVGSLCSFFVGNT